MKRFFAAIVLLIHVTLFAQRPDTIDRTPIQVSGKIIEEGTDEPIEYATIAFANRAGTIVTGGITDAKGKYSIEVPKGIYTITYEFISYSTKKVESQKLFKSTVLPEVKLVLNLESLNEVVIQAETTEVQVRLDKKIYTIGKDLTASGGTVSDALNNVPSVTVDVDGAIALRGNENVRILINGKPSAIAGFGDSGGLQQLPAEAIERVEVITSPSARYDAEGAAGILNIILKKQKTRGVNGSFKTDLGVPLLSGVTGNINWRTDKFNVFNTTNIRYADVPGNARFEAAFLDENRDNPLVIEDRKYQRIRQGFNTNLGIEYFLTERSSITATGFFRSGDNESKTTNLNSELSRANEFSIGRIRNELERRDNTNYQFSLNYVTNFNEEGHKLTADLQYEIGDNETRSFISEENTFPEIEVLPSEDITSSIDQREYLAQADYVLPIGENAQFEAGFRGNYKKTKTDYSLLEQQFANGGFIRNEDQSNVFDFTQNINAFYTQYGNKFGNFSFLLGLRVENTQIKGAVQSQITNTTGVDVISDFDKDFWAPFPTLNVIYEITEDENLTLGYNRRINRPRRHFINPFPSRSSEANVFQGNPNLNPAYASAFDLGYLKRWGKLTLTSSIYYNRTTDAFQIIREDTNEQTANGIPIIRTIPINLSTNQRYGFEAGVLYNPYKWLRFNSSINLFSFKNEGVFNEVDFGIKNSSWFTRFSSKITLPGKVDWQTTAFYRGPRKTAQIEIKGIFTANLAFSKDIMKDKGTLGFNIRDLFNSRKRKSTTTAPTFIRDSEFQWRERQFSLSFTYRFNQKKKRERTRGSNGGEDDFEG